MIESSILRLISSNFAKQIQNCVIVMREKNPLFHFSSIEDVGKTKSLKIINEKKILYSIYTLFTRFA